MITFDKALEIARGAKKRVNHCVEYTNAYMFSYDTGEETIGGDSPVVVMKNDGSTMNMSAYMWTGGKEFVREIPVD